jgi:Xaa-Pro aminopeptidase
MKIRLMYIILLLSVTFCSYVYAGDSGVEYNYVRNLEEIKIKEQRLTNFLKENNLDGVLLANQNNFAWITAGGDNHIVLGSESGSAIIYWSKKEKIVIVANNELPRIMNEELKGLEYKPVSYKWHDASTSGAKLKALKKLIKGKRIGADFVLEGTKLISAKFSKLRYSLTKYEIERYSWLNKKCASIVEFTCREVKPGMTEEQMQAIVSAKLLENGIVPTVLLIATNDRIYNYKHAITKTDTLKKYAMINICAKKWGLISAVTRFVHFGPLPEQLEKNQEHITNIYASILAKMNVGTEVSNVFSHLQEAYRKEGFPKGWEQHHQGGAIGYKEREYKAYFGCDYIIRKNQTFAWNPTLPGVKVEDTILVTNDGIKTLTYTGDWPSKKINFNSDMFLIPQILIR